MNDKERLSGHWRRLRHNAQRHGKSSPEAGEGGASGDQNLSSLSPMGVFGGGDDWN
jgi:hypothetical protein